MYEIIKFIMEISILHQNFPRILDKSSLLGISHFRSLSVLEGVYFNIGRENKLCWSIIIIGNRYKKIGSR